MYIYYIANSILRLESSTRQKTIPIAELMSKTDFDGDFYDSKSLLSNLLTYYPGFVKPSDVLTYEKSRNTIFTGVDSMNTEPSNTLLNKRLDNIKESIELLKQEQLFLQKQRIRNCQHILIVTSNNSSFFPSSTRHFATCKACGLTVNGSPRLEEIKVLNFKNSIFLNTDKDEWIKLRTIQISGEQLEALKHPERFNRSYLAQVVAQTPYMLTEVVDGLPMLPAHHKVVDNWKDYQEQYFNLD